LVEKLYRFVPLVERGIEQAVRRVLREEQVPAQEKVLSLFEEHTMIITRRKVGKPREFGRKVLLEAQRPIPHLLAFGGLLRPRGVFLVWVSSHGLGTLGGLLAMRSRIRTKPPRLQFVLGNGPNCVLCLACSVR
jgi:hypothetical protein